MPKPTEEQKNCSHTDTAGGICLNCGYDEALEEIEQEERGCSSMCNHPGCGCE